MSIPTCYVAFAPRTGLASVPTSLRAFHPQGPSFEAEGHAGSNKVLAILHSLPSALASWATLTVVLEPKWCPASGNKSVSGAKPQLVGPLWTLLTKHLAWYLKYYFLPSISEHNHCNICHENSVATRESAFGTVLYSTIS